jgi:hypothetical protein
LRDALDDSKKKRAGMPRKAAKQRQGRRSSLVRAQRSSRLLDIDGRHQWIEHHETALLHGRFFPHLDAGNGLHPLGHILRPDLVAVIGHLSGAHSHPVGRREGLGLPEERSGLAAALFSASAQDVSPRLLAGEESATLIERQRYFDRGIYDAQQSRGKQGKQNCWFSQAAQRAMRCGQSRTSSQIGRG